MSKSSGKKLKTPLDEISNSEMVFKALNKKLGGLDKLPSSEPIPKEDILETPSVGLNLLCGKDRGIRKGSIVLWYGPYGCFKSWVALELCREAQRKWPDKIVAYIDSEYRVDMRTASELIGINMEPHDTGVPRFVYRRPGGAEETWEEIGTMASSGLFSLIILDSNTALRAQKVADNDEFKFGEVGLSARISSAALQKYAPDIIDSGTILWTISQMRIESQGPFMVKAPTGGNAWRYYTTHEFQVERVEKEKDSEDQTLHIYTRKNKFDFSLLTHEVPMIMGKGIDQEGDIIKTAQEEGFITQSGSWLSFQGKQLGQGPVKSGEFLRENLDIKQQILDELYRTD